MKIYDAKVEETYRHLKTGEVFKERKDWEAKAQALEIMRTMDFGGNKEQRDLIYRQILIFLLGKMDQFDSEALLNPTI